jgi:hypothetical protein
MRWSGKFGAGCPKVLSFQLGVSVPSDPAIQLCSSSSRFSVWSCTEGARESLVDYECSPTPGPLAPLDDTKSRVFRIHASESTFPSDATVGRELPAAREAALAVQVDFQRVTGGGMVFIQWIASIYESCNHRPKRLRQY